MILPQPQRFSVRQQMLRSDYEAFYYRDGDLHHVAEHMHSFYEMYFFIRGEVMYKINDDILPLMAGDILLIPPNTVHQPIINDRSSEYVRIVIWFTQQYIDSLMLYESRDSITSVFDSVGSEGHRHFHRLSKDISTALHRDAISIVNELSQDQILSRSAANAKLISLLVSLNRWVMPESLPLDDMHSSNTDIYTVLEYINANLDKPLSLDIISDHTLISKYHLCRRFKDCTGATIWDYVLHRRLNMASSLMLEGIMPNDIYKKCGFKSYSSFFRAFKDTYGVAPREYYNSLRKN